MNLNILYSVPIKKLLTSSYQSIDDSVKGKKVKDTKTNIEIDTHYNLSYRKTGLIMGALQSRKSQSEHS